MLCHLIERGLYSHQCYMAAGGNHRELQMRHWVSRDEKKPCTMIESLTYYHTKDESCRFDIDSHIGMCFHGVEKTGQTTSDESVRLRSQCKLMSMCGGGRFASAFSYADERCFTILSGVQFKRLLRFFGYRWVNSNGTEKEDGSPVSLVDIATFVSLFEEYDLVSHEGFAQFYEKFNLNEVFTYDKSDDIFQVNAWFGELLRSLVPVRIQVYDGQHRMLLMALFSTGCFNPSTNVPLDRLSWEGSRYNKFNVSETQLNLEMTYSIGKPYKKNGSPTTCPKSALQQLMIAGDTITNGASNSIDPTFEELFQKMNAMLDGLARATGVVPYRFSTYWRVENKDMVPVKASDNFAHNGTLYHSCFVDLIASHGRFMRILLSDDKSEAHDWKSASASLQKWLPSMSLLPTGANKELNNAAAEMIAIWRATADKKSSRDNLTSLLEFVSTKKPQVSGLVRIQDFLSHFTSTSWMRKYIHGPARVVVEHFMCRYFIEQMIINHLRNHTERDENGPLHVGLRNGCKWDASVFPSWPNKAAFAKGAVSSVKAGLAPYGKAGDMNDRIEYALFAGMINDIIRTKKELGFDPDFFSRPVRDKNLTDENKEEQGLFDKAWKEARHSVQQEFLANGYALPTDADLPQKKKTTGPTYLFNDDMTLVRPLSDMDPEDDDEADMMEDAEEGTKPKKKKKKSRLYNIYFDVVARAKELAHSKSEEALVLVTKHLANNILREYLK